MIKIPKNLSDITADAGKSASNFWKKTKDSVTKAIDMDNDGTVSFKDFNLIAESVSNSAKKAISNARTSAEAKSQQAKLAQLSPFFREDLDSSAFFMTKLLHITEIDKQHAENPDCQGSIGFSTMQEDMKVLSIYRDQIGIFGLSFYPTIDNGIYYVDPSDRTKYIAIDEYFGYLKSQRVSELQIIAQALGAKHFRVTYKEKVSDASSKSVNANLNLGAGPRLIAAGGLSRSRNDSSEISVSIAAENYFPGHPPVEPELKYLKHEPNIEALIKMRMDPSSPIMHQKFTLEMGRSSGIKQNEAYKIDAVIKLLKVSASANIASETEKEANRLLEYEIEF